MVGSNGIVGTHSKYRVKGPGVITGRSGTIGKVHYTDNDFWPLNTSLFVKNFHGNYPRYVYYLLRNLQLQKFSAYTGVPSLNRNIIHPIPVLVPPLYEQQKIASKIDELLAYSDEIESYVEQARERAEGIEQSVLAKAFRGELVPQDSND